MAQHTQIVMTDDIDGTQASETIRFGLGGTQHEIDLSAAHADEFRKAVRPFVDAARKAGRTSRRASRASSRRSGPDPTQVRAWAKSTGIKVGDRGRMPNELITKFKAASQ